MKQVWHKYLTILFLSCSAVATAQHISEFTSVSPASQNGQLNLPPTHCFQLLAQEGDTLENGLVLLPVPDFTCFLSDDGQSNKGLLSLNHEIGGGHGGVTVFDIGLDSALQLWRLSNGASLDFGPLNGISRPCSGGITPWHTVVVGEESILPFDSDSNRYNDSGWLVEIDPVARKPIQKLWKAGNGLHENCTVMADEKTLYWGGDDGLYGFIFKYVANGKRKLAEGRLFVLIRGNSSSSLGYWIKVPNSTPEECNNINTFCFNHNAWNFSGVEDVEQGPDGRVYFAAKNSGRIWRFRDEGEIISELSVFVENQEYPIQTAYCTENVPWATGADNLAFDSEGNLWVLQDGGNNHIWVVAPSHSALHPAISLFATTPWGCEPTGITFSPDNHYLFLSLQHPSFTNQDTVSDAAGIQVVFNKASTLVIARNEFLGQHLSAGSDSLKDKNNSGWSNLQLFPNPPIDQKISIQSTEFEEGQLVHTSVYDGLGKQIGSSSSRVENGTIAMTLEPVVQGIFWIRVHCSNKSGAIPVVFR
jgi:secreted PhoX family phosphatase